MIPDNHFSFRSLIQIGVIAIVLLCVLTYVVFQARFLILGPQIVLESEPTEIHNERQIVLAGKAANISRLWLNDRPIFTDAQGNFSETLTLENGYTISTIRAQDRYGRATTIRRTFVYIPASFEQM